MKETNQKILRDILEVNLHVETGFLQELAQWCKDSLPSHASFSEVQAFKKQLLNALNEPGVVTPELYESWTDDDSYPTQEAVQQRLQEIWNACFG